MHKYTVEEKDSGQRLDKYIARLLPLAPKSFIYKALRNKDIRLNGKKAEGSEALKDGDEVLFRFPDVQFADLGGKEQETKKVSSGQGDKEFPSRFGTILYEDSDLILADKKNGVLSQKAKPEDVSINEVLLEYAGGKTELFTPSVCNRLDRNTSGLIIFAKTYRGAKEMAAALRQRSAKKYYLAAVPGHVTEPGHLKARLRKEETGNTVTILPAESSEGDLIETAYEPVAHTENGPEATLLKIDLMTGKTHQIRAHLASVGMPVLGDPKYGKQGDGERFHVNRMMLHSYELILPERGSWHTPVPPAFSKLFPGFREEQQ